MFLICWSDPKSTPFPFFPPQEIQSDLRPISLTCTLAKVIEGFAPSRFVAKIAEKLDPHQYARERHSTTPPWFISYRRFTRQLNCGNCGARMFLPITQRVLTWLTIQFFWRELAFFDIDRCLNYLDKGHPDGEIASCKDWKLSDWLEVTQGRYPARDETGCDFVCCNDQQSFAWLAFED